PSGQVCCQTQTQCWEGGCTEPQLAATHTVASRNSTLSSWQGCHGKFKRISRGAKE
ncbi:Uncharacterized protein DAT39_010775, partial [Clarias magur]